jgi:hypothetical protein
MLCSSPSLAPIRPVQSRINSFHQLQYLAERQGGVGKSADDHRMRRTISRRRGRMGRLYWSKRALGRHKQGKKKEKKIYLESTLL